MLPHVDAEHGILAVHQRRVLIGGRRDRETRLNPGDSPEARRRATDLSAEALDDLYRWAQIHPHQLTLPLSGNASHLYLLMAATTNPMRSRMPNGVIEVTYTDNTTTSLPLVNPTTWWPIDQDYLLDDFAFSLIPGGKKESAPPLALPTRLDLKTATFRTLDYATFPGKGGTIPGGSATLLDLPLNPQKPLKSLTIRPSTYEPIIGLISATLAKTE